MKSLLNIFTSIILLFLVFSCSQNNKKIEGTWIGVYSFSAEKGVEKSLKLPVRNLIVFSEKKNYQNGFKLDGYAEEFIDYNKNTRVLNSYKNNYEEFNDVIKQSTTDSLLLATIDKAGNIFGDIKVYKPLPDSLKVKKKCKPQLVNKKFVVESQKYRDTIFFKNDTLLLRSSNKKKNSFIRWERIQINGFDVIFMDNDVPYLINCIKNGSFETISFYDKKYSFQWVEIN